MLLSVTGEATRDSSTAAAFATSWNNVGEGSVYTREQFEDWFLPLDPKGFAGKSVLELGFGNGSLLYHAGAYGPARLAGVELGDTLARTRENLRHLPAGMLDLHQGDLTRVDLGGFDYVYCIGVLHHLASPDAGFSAVLRHTRPGGHFHCWVYAVEGNDVVIHVVDPVRRVASRLPWWVTKYGVALPLTVPYFLYAKSLRRVPAALAAHAPLGTYSQWIAQRPFKFFHHVAFDQLVTPETHYIPRSTVDRWLASPEVDPGSTYVRRRNGNSWTFGGQRRVILSPSARSCDAYE
jgi:SAM-dependent methyltransferase